MSWGARLSSVDALILGIIQGLTEFLPVSSSGHLVLGGYLLGLTQSHLVFDVVVHGATLLATCLYYRQTLAGMGGQLVRGRGQLLSAATWRSGFAEFPDLRLALLVIVGSVPTAVVGIVFKEPLEQLFGMPRVTAAMLLVTACVLTLTLLRRHPDKDIGEMSVRDALLIGLVQGMAVIPGISRSGSTIAIALLLGVNRELAARFSFILSIPAIVGALLLKGTELGSVEHLAPDALLTGFVAAALVGLLALAVFVPIVTRGRLHYFAIYLVPVGAIGCILLP